jgi:hypothetical protein
MKTKIVAALAILLSVGAAHCYFNRGIAVVVRNVGVQPIESVVVQATGFSRSLGQIAAGQTKQLKLSPRGESHLELEHADGPRLVINCYFENGYTGTISIDVAASQVVRKECALHVGIL